MFSSQRLQLRGSGGFAPRFPNTRWSDCISNSQEQVKATPAKRRYIHPATSELRHRQERQQMIQSLRFRGHKGGLSFRAQSDPDLRNHTERGRVETAHTAVNEGLLRRFGPDQSARSGPPK
jgi:hypothetical protein